MKIDSKTTAKNDDKGRCPIINEINSAKHMLMKVTKPITVDEAKFSSEILMTG